MKTKQYVIVENNDGNVSVETFSYTERGYKQAKKRFKEIAIENNIDFEIVFMHSATPDAIANVCNGEDYDLLLLQSN